MILFTIGFTKKTARQFFEALNGAGVKKLIDIRLNNTSQLAGFTKREDLEYFAQTICRASYHHMPNLAPTQEILDSLKKHNGTWAEYEQSFKSLLHKRGAIDKLERSFFEEPCCLLCSEATPEHCHRRLVAEEIQRRWPDTVIKHL